ncbi:integrase, catalytic region, zinc finger, CCHC-type containing protein [Tanacetum coccineum]
MLNKDNYVPWSSRLLRYAKSKSNGKLLVNSIKNDPYVRRMIHEPGDPNSVPPVAESNHEQTDDELTEKEVKQIEADDQAIQTILMGLPEDIYAAVDSYDTTQEIWLRVEQMMKGSSIGVQEKTTKLFNEWERFTSTEGESIESPNPKDIINPTTAMNMELVLMAKEFKLNYSTPTNNNQRPSSNPGNMQIAQPGMDTRQERQIQLFGGNGGNQFRQYAGKITRNQNGYNVRNQTRNGNVVAAWARGNGNGNNGNQVRCYNCRGMGHLARNCTVKPRRRDATCLQTQLLIAQKEEARIQLQAEEFDLMVAAGDINEIEEVNANCILMENL